MNEMLDQFQNSANYGYAHIEIGTKGSFIVPPLTVEMRFGETSEVAVMVSEGITRQKFSVERAEAKRFLSKIIAAANKPEVVSKAYSMMQHFANAEWRNLDFIEGEHSGVIQVFSNELPTEQIEGLLPTTKDASVAADLRKLLDKGLHQRAIEIHRETTAFVKRCLSEDRSKI